ncbi:glycerol-3-phosphate acyltransferase 3 isoform X2 [Gouania willdenowi]|uniref:glycerol-3-phosphate acyltransferase 3 isoform X2 n=1 Tax=Gouania willdenowi TaxID=441366 RepID=UPI0010547FF3|nr:glycerol-3-phosphate acyltransferase 3 isoform X2 [Gouania willdenowi]
MEEVWPALMQLFQLWMFVVLFLIMMPAMFGLSLGVTGVYIQVLVRILEWATIRIQRGLQNEPRVTVPLTTEIIERAGGSMEEELEQRRRTHSLSVGEFSLSDVLYFYKRGVETIVDDQVTQRFSSEELASWNLLTRTNQNFQYISLRLTIIWGLGVLVRYGILFPLRENRPQKGGICVANHTTPIDVVILANDGCYAMVGQIHGGLLGIIQRSMVRSCPHVWFERSEMKDRHAVTSRLRDHVAERTKLPILIFPEGTCVNNTSVMMFKKGSFEIGGTIHPVAIKYDPRFGDAFWNSSKYNMVSYVLRMMTSWAVVVNVWYLPAMSRQEGEDATHFANRVKSAIAAQGGLLDLAWDGGLKRARVKESFRQEQQKLYSSIIVGLKDHRKTQETITEDQDHHEPTEAEPPGGSTGLTESSTASNQPGSSNPHNEANSHRA